MGKRIFTLGIAAVMAGAMLSGCQSSATKVENAEDKVVEANKSLDQANLNLYQARTDSILQFRKESAEKLTSYDTQIIELKAKIASSKKETKAAYQKSLADIEKKNNEMKARLENFKDDAATSWNNFKAEFSHDMDELDKSLKDFSVKNVK